MRLLNTGGTSVTSSAYMNNSTIVAHAITANVWKAATSTTSAGFLKNFTMPQNNRLTYSGCDAVFNVDTVASFASNVNTTGVTGIMLNGVGQDASSSLDFATASGGIIYTTTTKNEVTLTDGDYIEFGLTDNSAVTFTLYKFTVSAQFKGYV